MTFTIEPMITLGTWQHRVWDDDWTAVTTDGKRTAQFEHTVLVTEDGVEVLTGGEARSAPSPPGTADTASSTGRSGVSGGRVRSNPPSGTECTRRRRVTRVHAQSRSLVRHQASSAAASSPASP